MKKKNYLTLSATFFLLFLIVVFLVKVVDVKESAVGSDIGLYALNDLLLPTSASNMMDKLSDLCLVLSMASFVGVFVLGVYQLIKRKSLKKVSSRVCHFFPSFQ